MLQISSVLSLLATVGLGRIGQQSLKKLKKKPATSAAASVAWNASSVPHRASSKKQKRHQLQ
jgi:hypothetical protein